jgi:protein gp37
MSDLFHEEIPTEYIKKIFDIMNKAHWHTFQILTKRSENLVQLAPHLNWSKNIWMGVSVENNDYVHRIKDLIKIPASVRFLSLEPLIGPLPGLRLRGIDWVIVGGESGPGCRPIEISWARDIRDKCNSMNVPFFFKQWGGVHKKRKGRKLDNKYWDEMPIVKERRVLKKSMIE